MDYREQVEVIGWMARYANFGGVDARVYCLMVSGSNYKSSEFSASAEQMAEELAVSKQSVIQALKRLEACGAIKKKSNAVGRSAAVYKIRKMDDMMLLHESKKRNEKYLGWLREKDSLFADIENDVLIIGDDCEDCNEDGHCHLHKVEIERKKQTREYKDLMLWLSDNPKPEAELSEVKRIDFKAVKGID